MLFVINEWHDTGIECTTPSTEPNVQQNEDNILSGNLKDFEMPKITGVLVITNICLPVSLLQWLKCGTFL